MAERRQERGDGLTLEQLQEIQRDAEALENQLEEDIRRASTAETRAIEGVLDRIREQGMEFPRELLQNIRAEIADIREKQQTVLGLQRKANLYKDIIALKKALLEDATGNEQKILTELKVTEELLKNAFLLEALQWHILKLFEVMLLEAKLP